MNNVRIALSLLMMTSLWCFAFAVPAQALLENHDCSFCHDFHGGPGYSALLTAVSSELVCLTCHTVDINTTKSAQVHNPLGLSSNQPGYITCRECHDAHDNQGGNVKMVGYKRDAQNWGASFIAPGIRKELPSTVGLTYNVVTYTGPADFNIAGSTVGACEACHASNHKVGKDCTLCHGHNSGFPSAGTGCLGCHDGTDGDAPVVTYDSPHSKNTLFAVTGPDSFDCVDCHTNHGSGTVEIPNNSAVGIQYSQNGEQGIALGSSKVTGATEAEICWNCHNTYGVSEWGVNTDTNGGFPDYDFGTLSGGPAPPWVNVAGDTGAVWSSANFQYKTDNIQSTHAANPTAGVAGLDARGNIRCSYCHDVHELNVLASDNTSGKPYLRGTWTGNPYREDGAPRWDGVGQDRHTYAENQTFGAVPRGNRGPYTSHYRTTQPPNDAYNYEIGGYWIDQNSGFPTRNAAYDSATKTAGLCELCHGDGDGSWIAAEINTIDEFAANNWLGTNGHANAVISGGGTASGVAGNIFTNAKRGNALTSITENSLGQIRAYTNTGGMGYFGWTSGSRLWGLRNNNEKSWYIGGEDAGTGVFPVAENPEEWGDARRAFHATWGSGFEWGNMWVGTDPDVTQDNATTDDRYHQFTCSKCHNPHASRLPRLMITNCLDVRNNTWDNQTTFDGQQGFAGDSDWTASGINYTGMVQSPGNKELAYSITAQNCHRAVDATTGWNTITPVNGPGGTWP